MDSGWTSVSPSVLVSAFVFSWIIVAGAFMIGKDIVEAPLSEKADTGSIMVVASFDIFLIFAVMIAFKESDNSWHMPSFPLDWLIIALMLFMIAAFSLLFFPTRFREAFLKLSRVFARN